MNLEGGQGQLIGFNSREGTDGWYTSLSIVVRTDSAPDISTLSRWLGQVARATNNKIGNSPVPIPKPRARLSAPKPAEPPAQPVYWNGEPAIITA